MIPAKWIPGLNAAHAGAIVPVFCSGCGQQIRVDKGGKHSKIEHCAKCRFRGKSRCTNQTSSSIRPRSRG